VLLAVDITVVEEVAKIIVVADVETVVMAVLAVLKLAMVV